MPGQVPGDGALSRTGRTINGYDNFSGRPQSAQRAIVQTHARFFVSCLDFALGRAVKPYRLLFPTLVPAVSAGLRLLRTGRASGRASLRSAPPFRLALALRAFAPGLAAALAPLLWPLRPLQAAAEGFAVRAPDPPLVGRAALPLE